MPTFHHAPSHTHLEVKARRRFQIDLESENARRKPAGLESKQRLCESNQFGAWLTTSVPDRCVYPILHFVRGSAIAAAKRWHWLGTRMRGGESWHAEVSSIA